MPHAPRGRDNPAAHRNPPISVAQSTLFISAQRFAPVNAIDRRAPEHEGADLGKARRIEPVLESPALQRDAVRRDLIIAGGLAPHKMVDLIFVIRSLTRYTFSQLSACV